MKKGPFVYLLLGPERGEKDRFISSLLQSIKSQTKELPEVTKLYAFESPIHHALSLLRNGSLFSKAKVVLYEGVETLKRKEEIEALLAYIKAPAPDGILLLLSDKPSVEKRLQEALPEGQKKIFWELFEQQKKDWVMRYFKQFGITPSSDAINLLLEMVENNTRDLEQVCSQVSAFYQGKDTLQANDIEEFLYHSKQESVYTLLERILEKKLEAALEILHKLFLEGETQGVGILISLTYQLRSFRDYLRLRKENYKPLDACTKLKIVSKKTQRMFLSAEQNYTLSQVEEMVALCADYDENLRSFRSDMHLLLLELFLYALIEGKGRNPIEATLLDR
ncbi:MAG: DNA polymerase III subunit delta [Spirochaetales bacterium]